MKKERISYLNGQFLPHDKCLIHIEDRGFQFADGVYEVTLFCNNQLIDGDLHIDRLFRSLKELAIVHDFKADDIKQIQLQLFAKNNIDKGFCYLNITRGNHSRVQNQPVATPTINASVKPVKDEELATIKIMSVEDIRWLRCDIKSVALSAASMLKQRAIDNGFDDVVMIRNDIITEASFANIFMVDNKGNIITKKCDNLILCGITRNRIIKLAQSRDIKVLQQDFTISQLKEAQEVFLTSSTLLVRAVTQIDNQIINNGKIGKITKDLFNDYKNFISCVESCQLPSSIL